MDGVLLSLCRLSDATTYDTSRQNILFKADIVTTATTTTITTTTTTTITVEKKTVKRKLKLVVVV